MPEKLLDKKLPEKLLDKKLPEKVKMSKYYPHIKPFPFPVQKLNYHYAQQTECSKVEPTFLYEKYLADEYDTIPYNAKVKNIILSHYFDVIYDCIPKILRYFTYEDLINMIIAEPNYFVYCCQKNNIKFPFKEYFNTINISKGKNYFLEKGKGWWVFDNKTLYEMKKTGMNPYNLRKVTFGKNLESEIGTINIINTTCIIHHSDILPNINRYEGMICLENYKTNFMKLWRKTFTFGAVYKKISLEEKNILQKSVENDEEFILYRGMSFKTIKDLLNFKYKIISWRSRFSDSTEIENTIGPSWRSSGGEFNECEFDTFTSWTRDPEYASKYAGKRYNYPFGFVLESVVKRDMVLAIVNNIKEYRKSPKQEFVCLPGKFVFKFYS